MTTVKELINKLKRFPKDMEIKLKCYPEQGRGIIIKKDGDTYGDILHTFWGKEESNRREIEKND